MRKQAKKDAPTHLLYGMPWVPSGSTDVQRTWRKFGWQPAHPEPTYESKGAQHVRPSTQKQ